MCSGYAALCELLDSLHQEVILLLKHDHRRWANTFIFDISVKVLFLSFFEWLFFFLYDVSFFVSDLLFLQENVLSIFKRSWEAVKDVASVAAIILVESDLQQLVNEFVRDSD